MQEMLSRKGFPNAALNNDKYTAIPLETGQFYQQTGDGNAEMVEDANEWMYEVWVDFSIQR